MKRNDIIEAIAEEYTLLYKEYPSAVMNILKIQGKLILAKKINMEIITLYDGIMSDDYYLTMSDLWVASLRFKLPIIFYTSTKFGETETQIIVGNKSLDDKYFFVKFTASKSGTIPKSRLLVNSINTSKISVNSLSADLKDEINNLVGESGIVNYLSNNEMAPIKKKRIIKKNKKLILKN